jgi:hypothetical protein
MVYGMMWALIVEMTRAGKLPGKKSVIVVTDPPYSAETTPTGPESEITCSGGVRLEIGGSA